MTLNKRERSIAIAVGAVVLLVGIYELIFDPMVSRLDDINNRRGALLISQQDANDTFKNERRLQKDWSAMLAGGLKSDNSSADSQALHSILEWAQEARVNLVALKPERSATAGKFNVLSYHMTGTGSTPAIARLLWAVETASIPVKVNDIQISPQPEGSDNLSIQLSVSTIWMPSEDKQANKTVAAASMIGGGS